MISQLRQAAAHRDARKLRHLYYHGRMTHAEIAARLGVGRSTISETMKRLGISPANRKPKQNLAGRGLPYGKIPADGKITASPEEVRAIKVMAKLRRQGQSYRAIAKKLNLLGVPTKTGLRLWAASTIMGVLKRSAHLSQNL